MKRANSLQDLSSGLWQLGAELNTHTCTQHTHTHTHTYNTHHNTTTQVLGNLKSP